MEASRVVVKAPLAGLWPMDFKRQVQQLVEMRNHRDNPQAVIADMREVGKEQSITE